MANYTETLDNIEMDTLQKRREILFERFTRKASTNARVKDKWFPLCPSNGHNTRNPLKYIEQSAKTERLAKSPLFQMRKLLNKIHKTND